MFSYISSFINYYSSENSSDTDDTEVKSNTAKIDENGEIDDESEKDAALQNAIMKKSLNGKVTSFFNNVGLINDHVYFTLSVVIGQIHPTIGDDVFAEVTRSHTEGGWVATKVQIIYLWEEDEKQEGPYKDKVIGHVTNVLNVNSQVLLSNSNIITVKQNKYGNSFKPYKGDWLQIEVWRQPDKNEDFLNSNDVISVSPLREKKVDGCVTDILKTYGFINSDIFFPFTACERGLKIKKGDNVIAMVIESKQSRAEWRAVTVILKKDKVNKENNIPAITSRNRQANSRLMCIDNIDFGDVEASIHKQIDVLVSNKDISSHMFHGVEVIGDTNSTIKLKLGPDFKQILSSGRNDLHDSFSKGKLLCPSMIIHPQEEKFLPVSFTSKFLGKTKFRMKFQFNGFCVECDIKANVVDDTHDLLKGVTPYEKPVSTFFGQKVNTRFTDSNIVPGQKPIRKRKVFLPNKLARYPVPTVTKNCILNSEYNIEKISPEITQCLHISNYKKKLSTLLHIEEMQMELEMRQFDLHCVILRPVREFLKLEVPGLAEGRPSLLLGDRVIVTFTNKGQSSPSYEGFIHEVHAVDILLKFNNDFHDSYRNEDLDVEFYFNRTPLRRCHQAIEHALNFGEEVLFPTSVSFKESLYDTSKNKLVPFNKNLNERQHIAVERIVQAQGRPVPYVLFGPPGTGKSVTVVEAILQVFTCIKHSRILACAPSNSAADLIVERLHSSGVLNKRQMIRLNAFQRVKANIPESIEQYCENDVEKLKFISRHRIIITTCNMAGYLYSLELKVGHFTHVFVDEAGQATEPECLIPVGFAAGSDESQVVLAGDPYQLGPVLRSDLCDECGLNVSLLERLTSTSLYERNEELYPEYGAYNPLVVTKLLNNYRSHKGLLKLSSSMFYNRELVPCAPLDLVQLFTGSKMLPNPEIPFIFHGLRSDDFREGNSPSWFNPMEAVQVVKYTHMVLSTRQDITLDDIGIITPYRKQVEKIRLLLKNCNLDGIKVGSVEEFQGQERKCIILSTVRSNEELVSFDSFHNVGFLSNPKRFNVAITRAQALLVIIGNPIVLCYDPYWCAMLQYAVIYNCYTGCELPSLDQPLVQENFKMALQLLGLASNNKSEINNESRDEHQNEVNIEQCGTDGSDMIVKNTNLDKSERSTNGNNKLVDAFVEQFTDHCETLYDETQTKNNQKSQSISEITTSASRVNNNTTCVTHVLSQTEKTSTNSASNANNDVFVSPMQRTNALLKSIQSKQTNDVNEAD